MDVHIQFYWERNSRNSQKRIKIQWYKCKKAHLIMDKYFYKKQSNNQTVFLDCLSSIQGANSALECLRGNAHISLNLKLWQFRIGP